MLKYKKIDITGLRDGWLLSKKGRGQNELLKKCKGGSSFIFTFLLEH